MDFETFILFIPVLLTCIYAFVIPCLGYSRLPPGPYPFPVIGNILKLGNKPHRSLATLSKHYDPLMSLKLGTRTTIVVSSSEVVKEFLHTYDKSFSSRTVPDVARVLDHHKHSMIWLPVGEKWRQQRRITKEYLFSAQRLDASELLRREKVGELLDYVNRCCINGKAVNIGSVAFMTTLNILSNLIFSKDFAKYDYVSSQDFKDTIWGCLEIGGKPNVADFFPVLKPLDPQGLVRQGNVYGKKLLGIFDKYIDQRLETRLRFSSHDDVPSTSNDVLDSFLNIHLKNESEFSRNDIKHLILALFFGGIDTTSSTIEWAMTELICNPEKMKMAQSELIKIMVDKNKNIHEVDISMLFYLQAVIKETLRLHPPVPLLVPHKAIQDIELQGFIVPKNAQVLFNVWAIGRDENVWSNPKMFMPERFLDVNIDYKGHDFELIPFGSGRRICPGMDLAHRMLPLMLGSLIYKFDWKLEGSTNAQDMDMGEKFGITLQRNEPLMAIPFKV